MELAPGVFALPGRLLWLEGSRALVAADAHLGYEDVIGGALPLWSTSEIAATLCRTAAELGALEIVLLGDALHGARMNEGAASTVRAALDAMRGVCTVTAIAGNHEGPSRGVSILGEVEDAVTRASRSEAIAACPRSCVRRAWWSCRLSRPIRTA